MKMAPSTIKLGKSRIRISIIVTIVELVLLIIGGLWMLLRKIPVNIKITPEAFLLGIVMGIFVLLSSAVFYFIDSHIFNLKMKKMIENFIYPAFSKVTVPEILLIAVLSGFCEEFFFRGILVPEFGIVIACGIFGFLHTPGKDAWFLGLWSALVGVFFSILYIKTGNLFVPIVAHAFNNLVAITYIRFAHDLMKKKMGDDAGDKRDMEEDDTPDEDVIDFPPVGIPEDEISEGDVNESVADVTSEDKDEEKVSSHVRLLDPSMLRGKIPIEDKDEKQTETEPEEETEKNKIPSVPEPAYEPLPHYHENKTERKNLLPDFDTLLGRTKERKAKSSGEKPAVSPVKIKKIDLEFKPVKKVEDKGEEQNKPSEKEPVKVEIRMDDKKPLFSGEDKLTVTIGKGNQNIESPTDPAKAEKSAGGVSKASSDGNKPLPQEAEKKQDEGKEPPKGSIPKDRKADDTDDDGIGVVNEPQ